MSVCLGLFDSGVGGLTVLRSILQRHGPVPTVYLGDTARVPYGSRSPAEIRSIAAEVERISAPAAPQKSPTLSPLATRLFRGGSPRAARHVRA